MWLISCNVLPKNHRVVADRAQVFDLAQTLRDGVLLCQLLNNLRPHTINLKEINLRPQMSQVQQKFLFTRILTLNVRKTNRKSAAKMVESDNIGAQNASDGIIRGKPCSKDLKRSLLLFQVSECKL